MVKQLVFVLSLCGALVVISNSAGPYSLRLVGGDGRCRGQLQVQRSGQNWTVVSPTNVPLWLGHRVCADLGCGSALAVRGKRGLFMAGVDLYPDRCDDSSLISCFGTDTFPPVYMLELICSDSVRLVEGRSLCSGSLQIRDEFQSWTWVREDALDRRGAAVLCRELGCGAPLLQGALYPLGQTFQCEGHESALMDCPRTQTDPGTVFRPGLHLTCSEPLRLVGGASPCKGTVEAGLRGEWKQVVPSDWEFAAAVCRDLHCGSVVSTGETDTKLKDVWRTSHDCAKKRTARDCVKAGDTGHYIALHVVCSEGNTQGLIVALVLVCVVLIITGTILTIYCKRNRDLVRRMQSLFTDN